MFGSFEDAFEDAAEFAAAPGVEAGGMRVAIDGDAVGNLVLAGDDFRAAPADEVAFDGVAIGVRADGTAAGVTIEIGRKGNGGR